MGERDYERQNHHVLDELARQQDNPRRESGYRRERFYRDAGLCVASPSSQHESSAPDIERWLLLNGVGRSLTYIKKRRWLFQQPGTNNAKGPRPNGDGNEARAIKIMREYPKLSLRDLRVLLKENGIKRSRE
jgi:hypothetical protein